jgi:hypothetical protein
MHYIATFHPRARTKNFTVNASPPGPDQWDVCAYLQSLSKAERAECLAPQSAVADRLKTDPAAPQWVREWRGPFHVTVEQIGQFFPALRRSLERNGPTCVR